MRQFSSARYYKTIEGYLSEEFSLSLIVCFLFYSFIFLLNQLLLMAQGILSKGIDLRSVLLLLLYSFPTVITLALPFATLTAALMAYGRFSSDNEILAMRSIGFSRGVIFRPILIWGTVLSLISFTANDLLLPIGTRAFQRLWLELTLTNPGLELDSQSVRKFRDSILVTGIIDETGIHPLIIIENDNSGDLRTMMARLAAPEIRSELGKLPGFNMYDIFSLTPDKQDINAWTWSNAESMEYYPLSDEPTAINKQAGPSNMRTSDIRDVVIEKEKSLSERVFEFEDNRNMKSWSLNLNYDALASTKNRNREKFQLELTKNFNELSAIIANTPSDRSLQVWRLEYYQKFAIPFACIPFVVLAFPLGLTARRSGRAVGFFIGLLLTAMYWTLLVVGRSVGLRTTVSPFTVMILPDLILLLIGILLFIRRSRI